MKLSIENFIFLKIEGVNRIKFGEMVCFYRRVLPCADIFIPFGESRLR